MFCHSEWYRDLIAKHRRADNVSPIVLWPYPIDPWPGGPLPDKYDLLIYAKMATVPNCLSIWPNSILATSRSTTGNTSATSFTTLPDARVHVRTWPMTIMGRWRCKRFCWRDAQPSACGPARR